MDDHRLYHDRAELYDAIYASKPYAEEAARLREVLAALGIADGARVLEAACGTGSYLRELARRYEVSGFDLSEDMLAVARRKVPGVPVFAADLNSFRVIAPFDAALCLFSSFAYLHDEQARARSLSCFAAALRPGGVLIIEPFVGPAAYREGATNLQVYEGPEVKCARASVSGRRGDLAVIDFAWLVVRAGAPAIEQFTERHELALVDQDALAAAAGAAGFEVVPVPARLVGDRALLVGVKKG